MRNGILALAFLACSACAGKEEWSSSAFVWGSGAAGNREAVSTVLGTKDGLDGMRIHITTAAGICQSLRDSVQPKGEKRILIDLWTRSGGRNVPPAQLGSYTVIGVLDPVPEGNVAFASYKGSDDACRVVDAATSTWGTVTLTRIDEGGYAGTFDLVFTNITHVTGDFSAPLCNGVRNEPYLCF